MKSTKGDPSPTLVRLGLSLRNMVPRQREHGLIAFGDGRFDVSRCLVLILQLPNQPFLVGDAARCAAADFSRGLGSP